MIAVFIPDLKYLFSRLFNKTSIFLITFGCGVIITRRFLIVHQKRKLLQNKVKEERKRRNKIIDNLRLSLANQTGDVQAKREKIVNADFNELRTLLLNDTYTPTEVLAAFQSRSLKVNDYTNCVCEFLIEAAVWAEELEKKFYKSNKRPLLYGIPISVKECFKIEGHDATIGFAQYLDNPVDRDSSMISTLKSLGAVPFVRTNIPQSMKSLGCSNPIYGLTTNPHDPSRSCGGSSGGEAALISLHGSPLGLGTDIGGSVRVPAHFCGICSLKLTVARVDQSGRRGAVPGCTAVQGTAGPMGNSVDSLVWFLRAVCSPDAKNVNPYAVPLPFNEGIFSSTKKLRIGFYNDDGFLEATPACKRAVLVAKMLLEASGHQLIPFEPPEVSHLISLYMASVIPDGGAYLSNLFQNDIIDDKQLELARFLAIPLSMKRIIGRSLSIFATKNALPYLSYAKNTSEMRRVFQTLSEYKEKFINLWQESGLDCVICPVLACPALPVDLPSKLFRGGGSYSILYNALDFPSGVIPVTKVSEEDERALVHYKTNDQLTRIVKEGSKGSAGLPVGVQIVALPFREEVCLRVMKILEELLKN